MKLYVGMLLAKGLHRHDFFDSISNKGTEVVTSLQKIAPIVAAVALVIVGFMFMWSDKSRQIAKDNILWIFLGMVVIFGAIAIATWMKGTTTGF